MSMSVDQEEKVIASLAEMGVVFPVAITYPSGRVTYVARLRPRRDIIITPRVDKDSNLIIFPRKSYPDLAPA